MKKIISAVALTALVAGAATADVKFNLNYRTQATLFSRLISAPGNNAPENHNYWFKNGQGYAAPSDTVSVVASNEYAGVTVRIDPTLKDESKNSEKLTVQQYSAYIRLGSFEVGAGVYKDGLYNGDYQLKTDLDDSFLGGDTAAAYKLGTMFSGAITQEMDNISSIGGNQGGVPAGYLQWKGNVGDSTVTATGSLIGLGDDNNTFDDQNSIASGFGFRLNAKFDSFQGQFVFKQANDGSKLQTSEKAHEIRAASLHVQLLDLVPNTKITVGGAAGWLKGDLTEANLDLRARYADGPLSVTFLTNISHITNHWYQDKADVSKHVGAYYLKDDATLTFVTSSKMNDKNFSHNSDQKYATAMWNFLGASYKLNETFTAFMFAGDLMNLQDSWAGIEAFAAPGIKIYAGGKSAISAFARFGWSHLHARTSTGDDYEKDGEGPDFAVIVPIIMRVRL